MQTNTCPAYKGLQAVALNVTTYQQRSHAEQLSIIEQMFDERPASDYVETLSDMLYHYLHIPRTDGVISPNHAANTTQVIHRLVRHVTALSEIASREHRLAA